MYPFFSCLCATTPPAPPSSPPTHKALPSPYNPPDHFIATANNKPFGSDYKYPIQGSFAPPWRITRIREMLTAKDKLSIDDFNTMLMDTHSILASQIAPVLAKLKPSDPKAQE